MSGKPKVYQGVRVKITVKELLQQRRARQAATGSAPRLQQPPHRSQVSQGCVEPVFHFPPPCHTTPVVPTQEKVKSGDERSHLGAPHKVPWGSNSSIQFAESVSPPHPEPLEAEPIPSVPSCCPSWQFSSCLSCEESPGYLEQLIDSCLQSDAASEAAFSACQPPSHYSPDAFQPVQLCFNQGLAASSPSSADLPSPWNYSCSPPQLSPLTPLTPSPPSSLDTKPYSCPMEEWACHPPCPFPSPACCCTACGSQNVDSRVPQCFPCPSKDCMEFLPPLAVAEDFFRRDRSCDICYS